MIDRLSERIKQLNNPSVVGLDPTLEMIPAEIKERYFAELGETPAAVAGMFFEFNRGLIDAFADLVPAVKPQIAMYEKYGLDGLGAYIDTIAYAKSRGLIVIGDIKRGDIASTAEAYAAHIGGTKIGEREFDLWQEDAVTLNPYLGSDSIEPFISYCNQRDRGLFILVKTSNPGSNELQELLCEGEPLYMKVAALVAGWGAKAMGKCGYSRIGAVVGATHPEQGRALRAALPRIFFLVPGYGAQGGTAEDLRGYFDKDGGGVLVNSSRGIIAAYRKAGTEDYAGAARQAVLAMRNDLNRVRCG